MPRKTRILVVDDEPKIRMFVRANLEARGYEVYLAQDGVEAVAFGDIFLEEVRKYREDNLAQLNMKGVFPIWGRNSAELVRSFISLGFKAVVSCINTKVLNEKFLGRQIDKDFIAELPPNIDPSGENGEFHSFVYDGPIFKEKIGYKRGESVLRDSFYFCDLIPTSH